MAICYSSVALYVSKLCVISCLILTFDSLTLDDNILKVSVLKFVRLLLTPDSCCKRLICGENCWKIWLFKQIESFTVVTTTSPSLVSTSASTTVDDVTCMSGMIFSWHAVIMQNVSEILLWKWRQMRCDMWCVELWTVCQLTEAVIIDVLCLLSWQRSYEAVLNAA